MTEAPPSWGLQCPAAYPHEPGASCAGPGQTSNVCRANKAHSPDKGMRVKMTKPQQLHFDRFMDQVISVKLRHPLPQQHTPGH
ncbi:hypothetical protein CEXT_497751 [Caerostris extrusa]|uniref:Uncharacterized protein n=1 Tax=Caerostris extrusa TaxID=172846 RepID=A0AAV4XS29_CAEEX|nr:hypothetical protein CEXT_497751 [Caerostris extrusa]